MNDIGTANYMLYSYFLHQTEQFQTSKKLGPEVRALQFFDRYYSPIFGKQWPSIRIALLSRPKYCALVNNLSRSRDDIIADLSSLGAYDINRPKKKAPKKKKVKKDGYEKDNEIESHEEAALNEQTSEISERRNDMDSSLSEDNTHSDTEERDDVDIHSDSEDEDIYSGRVGQVINMHDFIPPAKVYTQDELTLQTQQEQSLPVEDGEEVIQIIPRRDLKIPPELRVHIFPKRNVSTFKKPVGAGYYLMDAASLLPVFALSLTSNCRVLDLCSGPGGKALAMMQTMNIEQLTCVDISLSRLRRVRSVMDRYLGGVGHIIDYHHMNGIRWVAANPDVIYDRVLVDVPCTTDRHVLSPDEEDSIFKPARTKERLQLPKLQQELLKSGMQCCKPGGAVVYSTCTLSPGQNDQVVYAAIMDLHHNSEMQFVIEDLSCLVDAFRNVYYFDNHCKYGQLVLPHLAANFGPMYIAKIRRLN
ncbi:5-methylcytosine rRNA methyltransferase NSUN4 isoform X2 [Lingula anatina]|uniref:NOL1/NOP2/Sun domain family member 4 n=1 Tax=Lingula anatina TaxID=7574 RepID=A0A1S3JVL9_LINAN|nr:5-methylcytosine rRNA methyltransferase NSUN4 isoform X2 [Lingula anatina]|eukprot:XP_013414337.1 5-methylcytosine rRNA methyltransferase NSUN4 isoform X2 [Lingula anatina]